MSIKYVCDFCSKEDSNVRGIVTCKENIIMITDPLKSYTTKASDCTKHICAECLNKLGYKQEIPQPEFPEIPQSPNNQEK